MSLSSFLFISFPLSLVADSMDWYFRSLGRLERKGAPPSSGSMPAGQPLPLLLDLPLCHVLLPLPPAHWLPLARVRGWGRGHLIIPKILYILVPRLDKGKQPADDQQQWKRKQVVEADNDEVIEVCERSFMANMKRVERMDRYVSLNPTDDYKGRVMNIEKHFDTLPHHLYIPL